MTLLWICFFACQLNTTVFIFTLEYAIQICSHFYYSKEFKVNLIQYIHYFRKWVKVFFSLVSILSLKKKKKGLVFNTWTFLIRFFFFFFPTGVLSYLLENYFGLNQDINKITKDHETNVMGIRAGKWQQLQRVEVYIQNSPV